MLASSHLLLPLCISKIVAEIPCRIYTGGTMPGVILKAEEKEAIRHGVFQVIGFASEE